MQPKPRHHCLSVRATVHLHINWRRRSVEAESCYLAAGAVVVGEGVGKGVGDNKDEGVEERPSTDPGTGTDNVFLATVTLQGSR